jgi:hypothetical protein
VGEEGIGNETHTKATINYRHTFILVLENDEHAEVSDHEGKAAILWKAFKERMGKSDRSNMLFNVHELYSTQNSEIFDSLEVPFSEKKLRMSSKICQMTSHLALMASTMNSSNAVGQSLLQMSSSSSQISMKRK